MRKPDTKTKRKVGRMLMEKKRTKKRRYITGLDGVRTLAVLGVILYHLMPDRMRGGYLGVPRARFL